MKKLLLAILLLPLLTQAGTFVSDTNQANLFIGPLQGNADTATTATTATVATNDSNGHPIIGRYGYDYFQIVKAHTINDASSQILGLANIPLQQLGAATNAGVGNQNSGLPSTMVYDKTNMITRITLTSTNADTKFLRIRWYAYTNINSGAFTISALESSNNPLVTSPGTNQYQMSFTNALPGLPAGQIYCNMYFFLALTNPAPFWVNSMEVFTY